jgi:hypothetical protein
MRLRQYNDGYDELDGCEVLRGGWSGGKMTHKQVANRSERVYRVDKFITCFTA